MELYSVLGIFFLIGGIGIWIINKKSGDILENKNRWKKYFVYFFLVFGQLFLINARQYHCFCLFILAIGFIEIIAVGKTLKALLPGLAFFIFFGWFFFSFFAGEIKFWQQFLFVIVITFDGYSQLSGQLFGKIKLFPRTSPKKTLEGLCGGAISVIITAVIFSSLMNIEILKAAVSGLLIAGFAVLGDFLASVYKRAGNSKDYSRLIPGHGGILDRFDSLILAGAGFGFMLRIDFYNPLLLASMLYILLFSALFLISEISYHSLKFKAEATRKLVHFVSGILCLSFPFYLNNHWSVLALCLGFLVLLFGSQKLEMLKSVNSIGRKSYGSLLFPVAVYCCFLAFQYHDDNKAYFYLPVLILAVCDPLAALAGKKYPYGKYRNGEDFKTIIGSLAFFISCFLIVSSSFYHTGASSAEMLSDSLAVSALATLSEAYCKKGTDNLFVPLAVIGVLHLV
ncbi:MAG TPA: phosphatidate cytidylyltransferase [Flavobacterium sp.]|nr:phosphatidate cytidylyltransferase [Flavobacterium sp.]